MMNPVSVASVQIGPGGMGLAQIQRIIASLKGVDLVVFPELCHVPYFPIDPKANQANEALTLESSLVRGVKTTAGQHKCYVLFPLYLREDSAVYNAAVLVGPDGSLVVGRDIQGRKRVTYEKVHLCDVQYYGTGIYESAYFARGEGPVLWDTPLGTLGILICYDRHFPEAWRTLRLAGADIICVPIAAPVSTEPTFVAEMQAMALQQGVCVVVANRAGRETLVPSQITTEYLGRSCVIGPDGSVLAVAPAREPNTLVIAKLDPEALSRVRLGLPLLEHRRPETYFLEKR